MIGESHGRAGYDPLLPSAEPHHGHAHSGSDHVELGPNVRWLPISPSSRQCEDTEHLIVAASRNDDPASNRLIAGEYAVLSFILFGKRVEASGPASRIRSASPRPTDDLPCIARGHAIGISWQSSDR
ncbi:MAG: hypothetical protein D6690_04390 [Nitrospirae bacterium]|nr:MAG: hypothetical protein D6690_04390 [Nitrospirota bacterium]